MDNRPRSEWLPRIPHTKRIKYQNGLICTQERQLIEKINRNPIKALFPRFLSDREEHTIHELKDFYKKLSEAISNIPYDTLSDLEVKRIIEYINYVYHYSIPFTSSGSKINFLYRIVINENVSGVKDSLTKVSQLSYPEISKSKKYNRANLIGSSVFYGSETINTALNELKPKIGDLISVGKWQATPDNNNFKWHAIIKDVHVESNDISADARKQFKQKKEFTNPILYGWMDQYYSLFDREFSKKIKHENEYLISATLSNKILNDSKAALGVEAIIYPSVGHKLHTNNLAIKTDVIDKKKLQLSEVIEFEVTETNYDLTIDSRDQKLSSDQIDLVRYKNYKKTTNICDNNISWN